VPCLGPVGPNAHAAISAVVIAPPPEITTPGRTKCFGMLRRAFLFDGNLVPQHSLIVPIDYLWRPMSITV
jgi:hypothetical protein